MLPGVGGPFSAASQQDRAAGACFSLRAAPTASLAGGDVLLVGPGYLGSDSVPGQKMWKQERIQSFSTLEQPYILGTGSQGDPSPIYSLIPSPLFSSPANAIWLLLTVYSLIDAF